MTVRRTPWWLHLSLALPLGTIVVAAVLVMRGEREAVLQEARSLSQRLCDKAAEEFVIELAKLESRPLPEADATGHLRVDGILYPETPVPQPECAAQEWFARGEFERVLKEAPDAMSRAGLPLAPLCAWRLMQRATDEAALQTAWRRLVSEAIETHPSSLSESLLRKGERLLTSKGLSAAAADSDLIWRRWRDDEVLRGLMRANESKLMQPGFQWLGAMSAWVYYAGADHTAGWRIVPGPAVLDLCRRLIGEAQRELPVFASMRLIPQPLHMRERVAKNERQLALTDWAQVHALVVMNEGEIFHFFVLRHMRWTGGALALAFVLCALGAWQVLRGYRRQQQLAEQQSNFISSVSHELRAPLSSVRLMAESLCDGTVSEAERVAEYHRVMHEESTRLCSMVENVLDTARIERGVKTYAFAPCDPAALIDSATRILAPRAERQHVSWQVECASFDPLPMVDEESLRQALVNLLDNALKHSPEHTTITISAVRIEGARWTLSVADQGSGVPVSERERVFERFYRIGSELRRETTGAGLGLALVKHVVTGHGGTVTISDAPGGGALVVCSFDWQSNPHGPVPPLEASPIKLESRH